MERILLEEGIPLAGVRALLHQNKADGFACVSCAWAKPSDPRTAEFCENGAKATAWEITSRRVPTDPFEKHTHAELMSWSDRELEAMGRLTEPLRWNPQRSRYETVAWYSAIADIATRLRDVRHEHPDAAIFYTSGRASLEASYLFQLFARLFGNNNLPDSSNMCHESTSVALPQSIGVPVGTVYLEDFEKCDAVFFFGQNVGVSSPRMLHPLKDARERGVPIVTFNPLRESGLVEFADPQSPKHMLSRASTSMSTQYLQVRIGGDRAAIAGLCKSLFEVHADRLDGEFIATHTQGFESFAAWLATLAWADIERHSGLTRAALEAAADTFARARAVIGIYGMGLTQHPRGVETVQMVANLLLLGGHIGREGAGICPVRGHSNVQGQRTVGITEKPELAPLDKLAELYGFEPPRHKGRNTVDTCQGVLDGSVRAFVGLGGNFLRAIPDSPRIEAAWRSLDLTVHVATKLNRTHLIPGRASYILPCLGRIEVDRQASGEQRVSMEDSTGHMHASRGVAQPAAPGLHSEISIIAELARAVLPENPRVPWQEWKSDYARIRDSIEKTWPDIFRDFNKRFDQPGGFARPSPARERVWKTPSGKAQFRLPQDIRAVENDDVLTLMTLRSDNQFNTTIYRDDDHYRGIHGTRRVLLMNGADIARLGLRTGQTVRVVTAIDEDVLREVAGLTIVEYDIPPGCVAGYYPECNPLVPLSHHAAGSMVPAYKSIPVRIHGEHS